MKRTFIILMSTLIMCLSIKAQYIPTPEDLLVDDVVGSIEDNDNSLKSATTFDFYNNFNNWIPYFTSEPLKNPPIKTIDITFHVFLDDNGGNNNYLDNQDGRNRLAGIFNTINSIYSGGWGPSDPVSGVTELPNYDSKIRFSLGTGNERIYFYNNTSLNHSSSLSSLSSYVQQYYPSRFSALNIYFTAGYLYGRIDSIIVTNGGQGYTSAPSVTFSPTSAAGTAVISNGEVTSINITSGGSYSGYDPPLVTISGGGGSGATAIVNKLVGGASGYANFPSSSVLTNNQYVVMLHSHESTDWLNGMCIAHELAHNLELLHTYCGGGAPVVCCSGSCYQGCSQNCANTEYLSDIFGSCPGTCPHIANFGNPSDNTIPNAEKITNNVMGGSMAQLYFSPMQVGQMHRVLALKSTRKYVQDTYSSTPLVITNNETWNFNLKLYRDVIVSNNSILTISNTFDIPYNATITVNNGSALVLEGTIYIDNDNSIVINSGGTLKLGSSSHLYISGEGNIMVNSGGYFCIESGADLNLYDSYSFINLKDGYINGVNTNILPSATCFSSPNTYSINGNGKINDYSQDIYIQNVNITSSTFIAGKNIYIGYSVNPSESYGNVYINNNSSVIFDAEQNVILESGVEVSQGASIEIITS